jgi:hypothetical protein
MLKSSKTLLLLSFISTSFIFGQKDASKKILDINRAYTKGPEIDGVLDDEAWKGLKAATDFVMLRPTNGEKESNSHKTEVKVLYDNEAIYISAMLYDNDPSNIPMEFTSRDNFGQTDFFLVALNPNNDGLNTTEFIVMSTGTQADASVANGREDFNWSAVWKSAVKVNDKGWSVEMKIPYSALRFSNQDVQTWGINFHRKMVKQNAQYTWNHIDNTKGLWTQYDGVLKGIKKITPPTRLSFYPYASTSVSHFDGKSEFNNNLGLDLKYGITENFTLDLTLVPDFGQTAFDNITLNLGPFEQQFSEQRQFFTEGTELFNKGRMFYSRRIGNRPVGFGSAYDNLADNEEVIDNPTKVDMLNAVKISGRTKGGLGIGFFNAVTDQTEATINQTTIENGETIIKQRKKVTEPFANYNVLVLDQQFNQRSSITFINTNVMREGDFRDANVTGLLYRITNKKNTHFIDGYVKTSNINEKGVKETGYSFDTSIGKNAGNWRGEIGFNLEDDTFNINDIGFQRRNNKQTLYTNLSYRILKPTKHFNNIQINARFFSNYLYKPGKHSNNRFRLGFNATTKKRFSFGANINGDTQSWVDFYEPRREISEGKFLKRKARTNLFTFGSTDFRKKFAFNYRVWYSLFSKGERKAYSLKVTPTYRFTNQFSLSYDFRYQRDKNVLSYVNNIDLDPNNDIDNINNPIIFGKRSSKVYENSLNGKFNFSTKSSLTLSFRHFWTPVEFDADYFSLNNDGSLSNSDYKNNHNINYNSWNLDLNYQWQFAPGSQLIAFYRNSIFSENNNTELNFKKNIGELFNEPVLHTISLKFVYYIDYNNIKNIFKS